MRRYFIQSMLLITFSSFAAAENIKPTRFIFVRHGESDHNINGVFNSQPNHPKYTPSYLTKKGEADVDETGLQLHISGVQVHKIYHSPFPRTIQTSQIINQHFKLGSDQMISDDRLVEIGAGELEGLPVRTVPNNWDIDYIYNHHRGESKGEMTKRLCSFVNDVLKNDPSKNVVVVSHGSPILGFLKIFGKEISGKILPAGIAIVEYKGDLLNCDK